MLVLAALLAAAPPQVFAKAPPKVLFIGDSHSTGAFGRTLDQLLRDAARVADALRGARERLDGERAGRSRSLKARGAGPTARPGR